MTYNWKRWTCLGWLALIACTANAATPMVSFGTDHALALRSDGTVVAWGSDQNGKLGTGRPVYATTAAMVQGLTGVMAIGSGYYHSLAIRQDGTLWAWGSNIYGQLGDGTTADRTTPAQVTGISDVAMACGGISHTIALTRDGSVWSWGTNSSNQLGNGTDSNPLVPFTPARIAGLANVTAIACGDNNAFALVRDGTVWVWGSNRQGGLGIGDARMANQSRPIPVPGLADVIAIASGQWTGAAVKRDGTVWEWGTVFSTGVVRLSPVMSVGISGANRVSAAIFGIAAIKSDGLTWWFWEAGIAPTSQNPLGNLVQVARGSKHTLLLKGDRTVLAFGVGASGQLGDGTTNYRPNTPGPVLGVSNIVALAAGESHSLALNANGNVWAWGSDSSGQLGRGAVVSGSVPSEVAGLSNIVQVSAGDSHSLAVDQNGNVWSWGNNFNGQLGDDTVTSRSTPVRLTTPTNVQGVAAGEGHSLAFTRDGAVWAWGFNSVGQLGNGRNNEEQHAPIPVSGLTNVIAIAARNHSLAVRQDGTVWAWGRNEQGQLGLGTLTPLCCFSTPPDGRPAQVPGLSGVSSVAVSWNTSFAVKSDGTVMAWGRNAEGQAGDGSFASRATPAPVTGLTGVVELAASNFHALARRTDGSVWGWGRNLVGELGFNFFATLATPAPIAGISAIQQISAGYLSSAVLRQDGLVLTGGQNRTGQLGDGTFAQQPTFVLVANTSASGFLNLFPGNVVPVPAGLNVPFFVATYKAGDLNSLSLFADVRGLPASGTFASTSDFGKFAASYNVYVAAVVPALAASPYFQLNASNNWSVLRFPMAEFMRGVALDSHNNVVRAQILQNVDLSSPQLVGASILVGYGTDSDEMVRNARYRVIFTVPQP